MPKYGRTDGNQKEIIAALRAVGASVFDTSSLGKGFPDLVVGYQGTNHLMEIKDGSKPPSKRKLTPAEKKFFDAWRGTAIIVNSIDEALSAICVDYLLEKNYELHRRLTDE